MTRISIGPPTDFRRIDHLPRQRVSLAPLTLAPVVLKQDASLDASLPCRRSLLSTTLDEVTLFDPRRQTYRFPRSTPFERCEHLASSSFSTPPGRDAYAEPQEPSLPSLLSSHSSSSSVRSSRREGFNTRASVTSSSPCRNSLDDCHPKRNPRDRKRSRDDVDLGIDREILELNNVVELRRAEIFQSPSQETQHVPAIAPYMPVRARSETLSDIGSAFSRPLISPPPSVKAIAARSTVVTRPESIAQTVVECSLPKTPNRSRLSRPFLSMQDSSSTRSKSRHIWKPTSRMTRWLSGLLSPSTSPGLKSDALLPSNANNVTVLNDCSTFSTNLYAISYSDLPRTDVSSPRSHRSYGRPLTVSGSSGIITPETTHSVPNMRSELELMPTIDLERPWLEYTEQQTLVGVAL